MGLFSRKKTKDEKKEEPKKSDIKPVKVSDGGKKDVRAKKSSMKDLYGSQNGSQTTAPSGGGKKVAAAQKIKGRRRGQAYRLIIKPLVTEKAANLGTERKYVFEVAMNANKIEIAGALYEAYGIKPVSVNIVRVKGKEVKHGRIKGRRKDWKKAIVTLPQGQTINIYEGV